MARTRNKKIIFENERVETLCIQFKRTHDWGTYQRICEETNNLMDAIIRKSRFHRQAPFKDIKQHLFVQFERWIEKWVPGPGKVYTYFATSLTGDTKVMLADGSYMRLDEIVNGKKEVKVKAFDPTTGEFVNRRVVDWHRKPVPDRSVWRRVSIAAPGGNRIRLFTTHDHEFYTGGTACAHQPGSDESWKQIGDFGDSKVHVMGERLTDYGKQRVPVPCEVEVCGIVGKGTNKQRTRYVDGVREWYTPDFDWKYDITVEGDNTRNFLVEGDGPNPTPVITANCIKHGAISYVTREKLLHQRMAFTDKPLDALSADPSSTHSYEMDLDSDMADAIAMRVNKIRVRWQEPIIRDVLRYTIVAVVTGRASSKRREVLRTITLGWPTVNQDTAKFLVDWSIGAVRNALLDMYEVPLRNEDIIRAVDKFTFIPDVAKAIGWENTKKLMDVFAGVSVRFPSTVQVRRFALLQKVHAELQRNPSPENIAMLAKRERISTSRLQEQVEAIHSSIMDGALTDSLLFDEVDGFPKEVLTRLREEDGLSS